MLQIGMLGSGNAAARHAEALRATGVGTIAKIYSPAADAAAFASNQGASFANSADQLFADPAIDCIVIASPTDTHSGYLKQVSAARKHAVCETPLFRTESEATDIESLFRGHELVVSCGFIRHQAEYRHLRETVSSDGLGQIGMIRLSRCIPFPSSADDWRADFKRSGGVILDLLVHDLDLLEWCFGEVARIQAMRSVISAENPRLDYALITAKMKSGAIAHLEGSWVEAPNAGYCTYEIAGAQGILDYDSRSEPVITAYAKIDNHVTTKLCPAHAAYCALWQNLSGAIAGNQKLESPLSSALRSTRLALAALESSAINNPAVIKKP